MQDAVTEAVQAAVDEGMKFDVRANLYTIIAITGQIASMNFCGCRWRMFFNHPGENLALQGLFTLKYPLRDLMQALCFTGGAFGPPGETQRYLY